MFNKKELIRSNTPVINLKNRFLNYVDNQWDGEGFMQNNLFIMKPKFKGVFFQVYMECNFTDKKTYTEVQVEYKIELWIKILLLICLIASPLFYYYLKATNSYYIGSSINNNLDFLLLVMPFITISISSLLFYNELKELRKLIHYLCR